MENKWTTIVPEVPGKYWVDCPIIGKTIVSVFVRPGHNYLCINSPWVCQHTKSDFLMVCKLAAFWCGPIKEPER